MADPPRLVNLHDVITAAGHTVQPTVWPEEFVIAPDPAPPGTNTGPRPHAAGDLVILAALPDPAGVDRGHETVTLITTTTTAGIDLTGWHLADEAGGKQALTGTLTGWAVSRVTLSGGLSLGNKGDTLILSDADSATIDTVTYTAGTVHPAAPSASAAPEPLRHAARRQGRGRHRAATRLSPDTADYPDHRPPTTR